MERIRERCLKKKVYVSENMGPNSRGRPLGRWKDKVKEHTCKRGATRWGGLDQTRRECLDSVRCRLFCHGHNLRDIPRGSYGSEL